MTHPLPTLTPEQLRQLAAWLPEVVSLGIDHLYWGGFRIVRPTEYRELVSMAEDLLSDGQYRKYWCELTVVVGHRRTPSAPPSQRIAALAKVKGGQA